MTVCLRQQAHTKKRATELIDNLRHIPKSNTLIAPKLLLLDREKMPYPVLSEFLLLPQL